MTNFWRCLFKPFRHHKANRPMERLTEDEMSARVNAATENQKIAAQGVQVAAIRQLQEADYIRETLNGVLSRVNERERTKNYDG